MAVRNEAEHLDDAVAAVRSQRYPGSLSIVIAVAPSTDRTEQIAAAMADSSDDLTVVDNPIGTAPAGLNAAIDASSSNIIVRVDGHCTLPPGYVERAIRTLMRTGAVNVGGIQRARGTTPFECAVAEAMSSRFGTGDAIFHYGGNEGPTDTVYLGVFDRQAIDAVGRYDQHLVRNQDYELNIRLREAGGVVWFDPSLEVSYRPRGSVRALAHQYFDYGRWKRVVLADHPGSWRWRQVVPPVVTATLAVATGVGMWRPRVLAVPLGYAVAVAGAAWTAGTSMSSRIRLLAVFPTMHLSWGAGFLVGRRPRRSPGGADDA